MEPKPHQPIDQEPVGLTKGCALGFIWLRPSRRDVSVEVRIVHFGLDIACL